MNIAFSAFDDQAGISTFRQVEAGEKTETRRPGWVLWSWSQQDDTEGYEQRPWTSLPEAEQAWWRLMHPGKEDPDFVRLWWAPRLLQGDVLHTFEWSPRVGARWVCSCGWLGPTSEEWGQVIDQHCGGCGERHVTMVRGNPTLDNLEHRKPRRGPDIRITHPLQREPLAEITLDSIRGEGLGAWIDEADAAWRAGPRPLREAEVARITGELRERFARLVLKRKRLRPGDLETMFTVIRFEVVS